MKPYKKNNNKKFTVIVWSGQFWMAHGNWPMVCLKCRNWFQTTASVNTQFVCFSLYLLNQHINVYLSSRRLIYCDQCRNAIYTHKILFINIEFNWKNSENGSQASRQTAVDGNIRNMYLFWEGKKSLEKYYKIQCFAFWALHQTLKLQRMLIWFVAQLWGSYAFI